MLYIIIAFEKCLTGMWIDYLYTLLKMKYIVDYFDGYYCSLSVSRLHLVESGRTKDYLQRGLYQML
jgi:hypothetical protein